MERKLERDIKRQTEGDRGELRDRRRVAGAHVERGWAPVVGSAWAMTAGLRAHVPGHASLAAGLHWAPAFCWEAERQMLVLTPEWGGVRWGAVDT